jgi:hypothetical protein
MDPATLAFIGVATVIVVVPGPDMAIVARNTLSHGRRAGWITVLGIMTGFLAGRSPPRSVYQRCSQDRRPRSWS